MLLKNLQNDYWNQNIIEFFFLNVGMRKNFTLKHTSFHFTIITVQLTMWLNYILTFTDLQVVLKTKPCIVNDLLLSNHILYKDVFKKKNDFWRICNRALNNRILRLNVRDSLKTTYFFTANYQDIATTHESI